MSLLTQIEASMCPDFYPHVEEESVTLGKCETGGDKRQKVCAFFAPRERASGRWQIIAQKLVGGVSWGSVGRFKLGCSERPLEGSSDNESEMYVWHKRALGISSFVSLEW